MVTRKGYELYSSTDKRFVTDVIRLLQNEFSYRPSLSASQFLSSGYAERKIIFICDVVKLCRRKHQELRKLSQLSQMAGSPATQNAAALASAATRTALQASRGKPVAAAAAAAVAAVV
eukprot:g1957.t1